MASQEFLFGPEHFINRELSWLEFNQRVLDEVLDPSVPLLERVKFFSIVSSNLDEFFEVRVGGLKQQIESDVVERSVDGLTATETFRAIQKRVRLLVAQQYTCWREDLVPNLAKHGFHFLSFEDLSRKEREWIESYYKLNVRPVLTPLAIDPAHPFPQLLNKSLNIIIQLESAHLGETREHLAVVQVPRVLPRLVRLPRDERQHDYLLLGTIISHYFADLFPGVKIIGSWSFRVTRNSELYIEEEDVANLLKAVENELHNRRRGAAVRLEIDSDCPEEIRNRLLETLGLEEEDLYAIDGPLNPTRLMSLYEGDHSPELRDPAFVAPLPLRLRNCPDFFAAIRQKDMLLHQPYENFSGVVEFLTQAANDPDVLAIKQTLYRTGGDPRIVGALMAAVRNGKQVTAVVELKARFDEANNIQWARRLEEAGVHVVYGLVGLKIHGKVTLIVRKEEGGIRRYLHFSSGNYNPTTSRLYTDIGLLTCRPDFGEDATNLFNLLTGICQFQGAKKLLIAPFELHDRVLRLIRREAENARAGLPARIIAKMNALVDREIIEELYKASMAGVKIDLLVRGICCLRPGLPRISQNITVRSIVDRFLEHARIYYFENGCQPEVFLGSADWMPRNFFRRIEIVVPIDDGEIRERIQSEILATALSDNVKARMLQPDGSYLRASQKRGEKAVRSQFEFMRLALGEKPSLKARSKKGKYREVVVAPSPFAA